MNEYEAEQHPEDFRQELNEARKIQMGMLPQSVPEIPGFQIAAHSRPAVAVSGDFYDFIPLRTTEQFRGVPIKTTHR